MSPTKQARGDSGKERKLHRWQNGEKTLGQTRLSRGASSPPARRISRLFQLQQSQSVSGPLVPVVFPRWMSRWRGSHWRSVSGAHLGVLDSADVRAVEVVSRCWSSIYGRLWLSQYNCWWLASSEVLRGVVIVSSQVFGHLRSFKGWIQTEACVIPSIRWQKHRNSKIISVAVVPSRNNPGWNYQYNPS